MKRNWSGYRIFLGVCLLPGVAYAIDCASLPTQFTGNEFPNGNFFSNFDNSCYLIPFTATGGQGGQGADLNAVYNKLFYQVNPKYEIIIVGTYPNTRFFSVTAYDAHGAPGQTLNDADIVPLTSAYINPYAEGNSYAAGQKYAVSVGLGGTYGTLENGCMADGYNVDVNAIDASQRHQGMDWNSDAAVYKANPTFTNHIVDTPQHTNPNTGGVLMVRNYLDISPPGANLYAIVRDMASGCAYPAEYAVNTLQVVTVNPTLGNTWVDGIQANLHSIYENDYLPQLCFASDHPTNMLPWARGTEYISGADPAGSYIRAVVASGVPQNLAAAGRVMRIRFRIPQVPQTPCVAGCSLSGNEQLRYESLSFQNGVNTLASLPDSAFTQDANGNVTLVVGTGATIPSSVSTANGYTVFDLSAVPGYEQLTMLNLRNILPAATFNCSGEIVPYRTAVYTPAGGLMDEYLPVVDYPMATGLPSVATALPPANSCGILPNGLASPGPGCSVVASNPAKITALTTQCAAPGCNEVVVQAQPPLTIVGGGFGDFPGDLPFTGVTAYLEITDTTQNWDAGYTGDTCNVAMSSWANNRIQLVANVNQNGSCPLAAGDQLTVKVWNPQSMTSSSMTVTVASN
jgi:hypothetical protein